jgi:hypothetical protein
MTSSIYDMTDAEHAFDRAALVARDLQRQLGQGCYATAFADAEGNTYLFVSGTGEVNGNQGFAYDSDDVRSYLDGLDGTLDYSDFCDSVDAVVDIEVAVAAAAEGWVICEGGSCRPVSTMIRNLVALVDVTPNRGTVLYVGEDECAAREACKAAGGPGGTRILPEHPDSAETPAVGARVYHDHEYAWTAVGYSEAQS